MATVAEPLTGIRDGYYAWTWGDALFVVLDPWWYSTRQHDGMDNWDSTLGSAQYQWLKRTLAKSDKRWKFVFAHDLVGGMDQNMRGGDATASMNGVAATRTAVGALPTTGRDGSHRFTNC